MSLCSLSNLTIGVSSSSERILFVRPKKLSGYLGKLFDDFLTTKNQR